MGYVPSVRVGPGFGDFLGLREKTLHAMPGGGLPSQVKCNRLHR
jgi:hypothetical protein